jgi:hypothetical protein
MNNIKISVLANGDRVIAKTSEATREIEGKIQFIGYVLTDPQFVEVQEAQTLTEDISESVSILLKPWIDLSIDKQFLVPPTQIVTMCDPIEEVMNIYIEKVGDSDDA